MSQAEKKTVTAVSNFQPSSSSSISDEGTSKPLFVVLYYRSESAMCLLELKTPANNLNEHDAAELTLEGIEKRPLEEYDYVERIDFNKHHRAGNPVEWVFAPPRSPNSFMYIVPRHGDTTGYKTFPGFLYDIKTRKKQAIKTLPHSKRNGCLVNCKGQAYFLAHPDSFYPKPHHTFELYNPDKGKWVPLEPFPKHVARLFGLVKATAVWDDTILYNMDRALEFWAYNVDKNKWYHVEVIDGDKRFTSNRCYAIFGEAVVRGNTIYALTTRNPNAILQISIEMKNNEDGFAYKCTLVSEISVPGLKPVGYDHDDTWRWSMNLVYLDDDNFCLVQSCDYFITWEFQPLQLTTIKLVEKKGEKSMLTVTGSRLYEVYKGDYGVDTKFNVALCFSLPEDKGLTPVQASTPAGAASKRSETYKGSFGAQGEDDPTNTTLFVGNVDANVTAGHLRQLFSPYGQLLHVKILVGKRCAFVQFADRSCAEEALRKLDGTQLAGQSLRLSRRRITNRQPQAFASQWNSSYAYAPTAWATAGSTQIPRYPGYSPIYCPTARATQIPCYPGYSPIYGPTARATQLPSYPSYEYGPIYAPTAGATHVPSYIAYGYGS